jgi:hypothetical protein
LHCLCKCVCELTDSLAQACKDGHMSQSVKIPAPPTEVVQGTANV